jgi:hypothetical protein
MRALAVFILVMTTATAEAQVSKRFCINGSSTGAGWSFAIIKNHALYCKGVVTAGTVQDGDGCDKLTQAFVLGMRLKCELADRKFRIEVDPDHPCCFTINDVGNPDDFRFFVGAENEDPASGCEVTNNPAGCSFNPTITEILTADVDAAHGAVRPQLLAGPNPAVAKATLSFTLSTLEGVRLDVLDLRGRRVRHIVTDRFAAGRHVRTWDLTADSGARVPPGIYLVQLTVGREKLVRRLAIIR